MTFRPSRSADGWYGVVFVLTLLVLDSQIIKQVIGRAIDGISFLALVWVLVSVLVIAYIGYRSLAAFTLEYRVDRDGVIVVWGSARQVIPMGQIIRIQRGTALRPAHGAWPWHWPCPHRRRMICSGLGVVNAYATRPLGEQVILVTASESYGLSPANEVGFLAALQERYALGAARSLQADLRRPPLWTWSLWRDWTALFLIVAGLLGVLVMFGGLSFRFPDLSSDLPLHFDVAGIPDRIAPKSGLFALPIIGLMAWVFNLASGVIMYRRKQSQGAYLLWGGAVVVQGIAGLALFNLMRW